MSSLQFICFILLLITGLSGCSDDRSSKAYADCMDRMEKISGTTTTRDVEACLKVASAVREGSKLNMLYEDRVRYMRRQCGRNITMYDKGKEILLAMDGIVTDHHFGITLICSTGEIFGH